MEGHKGKWEAAFTITGGKKGTAMEKKSIDWGNIGFGYMQTDRRYVSFFKDGAWDDGVLTEDANIVLNERSEERRVGKEC